MNTLKRTIFLLMSIAVPFMVTAQNVTFYSSEFAEGVKIHLGLDANSVVTQQQTDTITAINLSGLGINDIRDVVYLPNVHTLNLSYNDIRDVAPLLPLDSLHYVDLRGNQLQDINVLSFSCSDSLVLSVAYNYITDFSRILMPSSCHISISGMSAQKDKHPSYMDVYQFYADIQEGQPVINYRGYSSMGSGIILECGNTQVAAEMTGNFNTVRITDNLSSTTIATLSNGEKGDTTWVIPPMEYETMPEQTITVETELPDNYKIGFANALHGTVVIDGTDLVYTAPDTEMCDTLSFSYYERGVLRGFSRYYLGKPRIHLGDVNGDGVVNITDISLIVAHILGETLPVFIKQNADMNNDKSINVTDVTSVVSIVLNDLAPKAPANARYDMDDRVVLAANSSGCSICLDGNAPFTACEMTLNLPEGCTLLDASLDSHQPTSHQVAVHSIGDGRYRLVVYAPADGRSRLGEGALVNLGLNGRSDGIKVSDIMFSNRQYETVVLQDAVGMTTGLDGVLSTDAADDTYSIQGIKTTTPRKGVYIKGHKKKVVKH